MELSKQEMELILMPLILKFEEKKFYYKMFIIFYKEFKTSFENNYWIMQTGELGKFFLDKKFFYKTKLENI